MAAAIELPYTVLQPSLSDTPYGGCAPSITQLNHLPNSANSRRMWC